LIPLIDFEWDEVIVIDNGSADGTSEMMAAEFPQVLYHRLPENIGVGPARNRGVAMSCGQYLMTLDNDTTLVPSGRPLGEIVESFFATHPSIGLFGCELLNPDGTRQRSARRFPRFLNPIASRIPGIRSLRWFRRMLAEHLMEDMDLGSGEDSVEVDYVLGANQIFRREVLANTYAYDPNIFYGPEDYEFCLRLWRSGWSVAWAPIFRVIHEHRRVTRKFSMLTLRFIAAHVYVFWKYKGFVLRRR
jgi:GT2 family glycosyltransferase